MADHHIMTYLDARANLKRGPPDPRILEIRSPRFQEFRVVLLTEPKDFKNFAPPGILEIGTRNS